VLPVPAGRQLYKFVVDDTDWIVDPAHPWISEDGQNNSRMHARRRRIATAKKWLCSR
jgi:hypothetical protein